MKKCEKFRRKLLRFGGIPIIAVVFMFLFAAFLSAKGIVTGDDKLYQSSRRDKFFANHFIDGQTGVVVGNKGLLLRTTDRGKIWHRIETETREPLNDVTFVKNHGWIVGGGGLVLYSADRGATWAKQETGSGESLMAAHFFDSQRGIIVGVAGTILATADGGTTWEQHPFDWVSNLPACAIQKCILSPSLYDIFFVDQQHGWIVGEKGTVMATNDGGVEWKLLDVGNYPSLYGVHFSDEMQGIAVGKDTAFLTTTDGGVSWTQKIFPPNPMGPVDLNAITINGNNGIIVGDRSLVLLSHDGGKQWMPSRALMKPPMPFLAAACIIPENSSKEVSIVGAGTIAMLPMN